MFIHSIPYLTEGVFFLFVLLIGFALLFILVGIVLIAVTSLFAVLMDALLNLKCYYLSKENKKILKGLREFGGKVLSKFYYIGSYLFGYYD